MTAPTLATAAPPLTVAVIGNPNTGKSTLFTALTGVHSHIGNYPGVTVEKKIGHFRHEGREVELVDLPGTYSLSPRSLDEMVSVEVLLGRATGIGEFTHIHFLMRMGDGWAEDAYLARQPFFLREVKIDVGRGEDEP